MKHHNVAIFIPHNGCPFQCSFCNQREITGQAYQPDSFDVKTTIENAVENLGKDTYNSEIAFFGGSFTAIDRKYMVSLLDATVPYIDKFIGIRISTRPDYIDDEILKLLKSYNVTTIELGAQSMDDEVLTANNRGHSAEDVVNASNLIKKYGFNLGLQMMTGLYKADFEKDINTARRFISLKPDCVRIYPTVVVENTSLALLYKNKEYVPYTLEQSVDLCSRLLMMFYDEGIDVIRLGLHYSDSLVKSAVADNYHPAFKDLCESKIFYDNIMREISHCESKNIILVANPSSVSRLAGHKRCNIKKLENMNFNVKISTDKNLDKYEVSVKEQK